MNVSTQTAWLNVTPEFKHHRMGEVIFLTNLWADLWNTALSLVQEPSTIKEKQELYMKTSIIVSSFGCIYLNKVGSMSPAQATEALELTKNAIKIAMIDFILKI